MPSHHLYYIYFEDELREAATTRSPNTGKGGQVMFRHIIMRKKGILLTFATTHCHTHYIKKDLKNTIVR